MIPLELASEETVPEVMEAPTAVEEVPEMVVEEPVNSESEELQAP